MTAPEDTSKRLPETHLLGMLDGSESYITGMEADGQRQLLASTTLPKEGPWDALAQLGFVKGAPVDELFVRAELPAGWSKEGSDHAMHSYILDERGLRRVNVFYKAAFYDRRADMHLFSPGYSASTDALYGDEPAALPEKWALFTDEERVEFIAGIDGMAEQIKDCPQVYGKYAARVAAIRELLAAAVQS